MGRHAWTFLRDYQNVANDLTSKRSSKMLFSIIFAFFIFHKDGGKSGVAITLF